MENISSRGSEASILTYTATAIQSIGEVDKIVQVQDQSYSKVCPICLEPQLWQEALPTWWEAGIGCFISRLHHDDRCYFSNRWCVCCAESAFGDANWWFVSSAAKASWVAVMYTMNNHTTLMRVCDSMTYKPLDCASVVTATLHALFGKECI